MVAVFTIIMSVLVPVIIKQMSEIKMNHLLGDDLIELNDSIDFKIDKGVIQIPE